MGLSPRLKRVRMELAEMVSPKTKRTFEDDWPPSPQDVREILAAIERIDDGSYGYCVSCHMHIPEERLEAKPYAGRCLACQQRIERQRMAS